VINLPLFGKVEAGADRAQHPPAPSDITSVTGKWRIETMEINGPVQIGEVRVAADDLVVADDTGVCFIPRDVPSC
jgi:4-hydroxy-4-methyl-2-oxoglutarate aldolase